MLRTMLSAALCLSLFACDTTDEAAPPPSATPTVEPSVPEGAANTRLQRPDLDSVDLQLQPHVDGLNSPLGYITANDDSGRMFVVEQEGIIRVVEQGEVTGEFLDISEKTEAGGEQGLLGLAFHPSYPDDPRFFVNYTDNNGDTVVASYEAPADGSADPASERVLLQIDQPYSNHNGGHIDFGPDGFLYIATGDGGGAGDPENNGQRLDTLLGKLLRIDVDRGDPYGIPKGNPFAGDDEARPEIWAYGLRNPWRFSFDQPTKTLWVGDVGQGELEEIDRVAADEGGLDYGWDDMEGSACYEDGCDPNGRVLPITEYSHADGCSVTGGYVYRGDAHRDLNGAYLFADFCSGSLWGIDAQVAGPVEPQLLVRNNNAISSFGRDESGELYVTDLGSGEVLKLVDAS